MTEGMKELETDERLFLIQWEQQFIGTFILLEEIEDEPDLEAIVIIKRLDDFELLMRAFMKRVLEQVLACEADRFPLDFILILDADLEHLLELLFIAGFRLMLDILDAEEERLVGVVHDDVELAQYKIKFSIILMLNEGINQYMFSFCSASIFSKQVCVLGKVCQVVLIESR